MADAPAMPVAPPTPWTHWSLFLAVSWTWCIGMVFPVLLVRDYTAWGWVVFAVPNVIGAAAVGFVNYGRHRAFLLRHRAAMGWFSAITILFHVFVAGWLVPRLIGPMGSALFILLTLGIWRLGRHESERDHALVRLAWWGTMVAAAVMLLRREEMVRGLPWELDHATARNLAFLAPGIVLGFLASPHLDLTLHRARHAADATGVARRVFAYGFGVLFLLMIALSLVYARTLEISVNAWLISPPTIHVSLRWALGAHLAVQSAITCALHLRHLPTRHLGSPHRMLTLAFLVGGLLALGRAGRPLPVWLSMDAGEVIYRVFLGAYGYVFPAYVLVAMVARRHEPDGPSTRTWLWVAGIVIVATPMFALAFLWRQEAWTLAAVATVVGGAAMSGWGVKRIANG